MHGECNVAHVDTRNTGLKGLIMQARWKPRIVYCPLIFLSEISSSSPHNTLKTIKKKKKEKERGKVRKKRADRNKNVDGRPARGSIVVEAVMKTNI